MTEPISTAMSFLEMLDVVNEKLTKEGKEVLSNLSKVDELLEGGKENEN